eukprot:TRINITY_DN1024_c0_g1_i3.p1 TRINITY_DN1024_c0_g1~~TRINITY_DN1024_c0_g1_i3.p1  ORF type:complete len:660 (-),score=189.15 TRINITY_DN1024_c0_g1_i3:51-2030(-)
MSTEWQSEAFRSSLVRKLEEAIKDSGATNGRTAAQMENEVFRRSQNKEDYLGYVAKLILHVKQNGRNMQDGQPMGVMNTGMPQSQAQPQQQQQRLITATGMQGQMQQQQNRMQMQRMPVQQQQQMMMQQQHLQVQLRNRMQQPGAGQGMQQPGAGPGMQQPGAGPGMQQQPGAGPGMQQPGAGPGMQAAPGSITGGPGMGGGTSMSSGPGMTGGPGGMTSGPSGITSGPGIQGGPAGLTGSGGPGGMTTGPGVMTSGPSSMTAGGPGIAGPGMTGGRGMSQLQQALQQRAQVGPDMQQSIRQQGMTMGIGGPGYTMRPGVPNTGATPVSQGPSPIPYAQSPQGQMGQNSPMGNPVPSPVGGQRSGSLAPSPSSQVNTPMNPVNEGERDYLDKLKSLEKYIEPLRRVIRRHGNEDNNEKLTKMKRLLDILSNPEKRVPLLTLQRCEDVLKRMQLDTQDDTSDINLQANPDKNPLIDAILKLQQNAKDGKGVSLNNSLANTFIPPVETVLGPEICLPPLPRTPPASDESKDRLPDILQGEIARLDPRFRVAFASSQPDYCSTSVDLVCQLDDKDLPAVPPLRITIPPNYPDYPPSVDLDSPQFLTTPFLDEVSAALSSRVNRMAHRFTLSQLLTAWELSVRSACPPSHLKHVQQPSPLFTM